MGLTPKILGTPIGIADRDPCVTGILSCFSYMCGSWDGGPFDCTILWIIYGVEC